MTKSDIVYVVWYDNMEEYEDNYQDIEGVFSTYENAVEFIESKGYVENKDKGNMWEEANDDPNWYWADSIMYIRLFSIDGKELKLVIDGWREHGEVSN